MQQVPALFKVRKAEGKKTSARTHNELRHKKPQKICWLLMSKPDQDRLYTIVDYDKVDK
jgi:hypothetical protein